MNAFACFRREPDLEDVMRDPIIRLLMRQDRVTEADIHDLGRVVRRRLSEGASAPHAQCGAGAL